MTHKTRCNAIAKAQTCSRMIIRGTRHSCFVISEESAQIQSDDATPASCFPTFILLYDFFFALSTQVKLDCIIVEM